MSENDRSTYRIIDANLNRLGEALRYLEEIARFALDDARLSAELKNLRHKISVSNPELKNTLIAARDEENDVGFDMKYEVQNRTFYQSVVANSRRAEECLRVLEEISKVPDSHLECGVFQEMRFRIYSIEKKLLACLTRIDSIELLKGLYVVLDTKFLNGRDPIKLTEEILRAGTKVIQLRAKDYNTKNFIELAEKLASICHKRNALLIINDRLDVVMATNADGLHVGQEDMPVKKARELLNIDKIIGCSANTVEDALKAKEDGADYIGVGAIYPTSSKHNAEVVGPEAIIKIKEKCDIPVVAIGGINQNNCHEIKQAGADSIAVISAVLSADSPLEASINLIKEFSHN